MASPVLLLREPSADGPDKYESAFSQAGYIPISVSVLETVLVNVPKLKDLILKGPTSAGIEGVIVTSKRSCEAWREALKLAVDTDGTGAGISVCLFGNGGIAEIQTRRGMVKHAILCRWTNHPGVPE